MWKELMECMSEHTGVISSYQLLIAAACTNTGGKMKYSHSRAADRCPFVPRHSVSQVTSFMQLGMLWQEMFPFDDVIMNYHISTNSVRVMVVVFILTRHKINYRWWEISIHCWCSPVNIKSNQCASAIKNGSNIGILHMPKSNRLSSQYLF